MGTADGEKTLYFRHRSATDGEGLLPDKTWDDLNGEALFERVDRTSSAIGRQYLYSLLRYDRVSDVRRCKEVVDGFAADKALRPLQQKLSAFRFHVRLESEAALLAWLLVEVLNIVFLREVVSVAKAFRLLKDRRSELHAVFRFWGMADVLCSVSVLRDELPYHTRLKTCQEGETFRADGLYHPLLEDCVSNSLTLCGQSALITGSNMSGKTTFIRAVGVSVLCGKALDTCFAEAFCLLPDTKLHSAIHVEDDLMAGRSLFLQEVQTMKEMLEQSKQGSCLFLLDELFKGTNTTERIAIAKAVLAALATQRNVVFASTHDIELSSLLTGQYSLYHFCETVADGKLSFDYLLKPGPVTERNAIRIIELYGYPAEVVEEARRCADRGG